MRRAAHRRANAGKWFRFTVRRLLTLVVMRRAAEAWDHGGVKSRLKWTALPLATNRGFAYW
jgi:hypothetical protein